MTLSEFNAIANELFDDIVRLMERKNRIYADTENIFMNFNKAASLLGMTPEKYLFTLKTKHELALHEAISKNDYDFKLIDEYIKDCILYYMILYCMIRSKVSEEW